MGKIVYQDNEIKIVEEGNILIAEYLCEEITLPIARKMVEKRIEYTKGEAKKAIADLSRVKSGTREARMFLGSEQAQEGLLKVALLSNSLTQKLLINFYLGLTSNKIPMRMFSKKAFALKWLDEAI
jgi:hypothetical protein